MIEGKSVLSLLEGVPAGLELETGKRSWEGIRLEFSLMGPEKIQVLLFTGNPFIVDVGLRSLATFRHGSGRTATRKIIRQSSSLNLEPSRSRSQEHPLRSLQPQPQIAGGESRRRLDGR